MAEVLVLAFTMQHIKESIVKNLNINELKAVSGGGLMREIGYEIGSGLAGDWGKELGGWLYEITH